MLIGWKLRRDLPWLLRMLFLGAVKGYYTRKMKYIEFYDAMSVPMAIALSGQPLLGQFVMVKPSEAEKNLVPSNASGGTCVIGPYGAKDRKLYVGNLHFNMTEFQLKQIFEAFGPVELVQLPTDPETGHCKGFGFVQELKLDVESGAYILDNIHKDVDIGVYTFSFEGFV